MPFLCPCARLFEAFGLLPKPNPTSKATPIHDNIYEANEITNRKMGTCCGIHVTTSPWPLSVAARRTRALAHGQPFYCDHSRKPTCPIPAALVHVKLSQGKPFDRAHGRIPRCLPAAVQVRVQSFQSQLLNRARARTRRYPPLVALAPVEASGSPPLKNANMLHFGSTDARHCIPGAPVVPSLQENAKPEHVPLSQYHHLYCEHSKHRRASLQQPWST